MHIEIFFIDTNEPREENFKKEIVELCKKRDFPFEFRHKVYIEIFVRDTEAPREDSFIKAVCDLCKLRDFQFELYDKYGDADSDQIGSEELEELLDSESEFYTEY